MPQENVFTETLFILFLYLCGAVNHVEQLVALVWQSFIFLGHEDSMSCRLCVFIKMHKSESVMQRYLGKVLFCLWLADLL